MNVVFFERGGKKALIAVRIVPRLTYNANGPSLLNSEHMHALLDMNYFNMVSRIISYL